MLLRRFMSDRRGNFVVMAGCSFVVLAFAIGGGVDMSMLSRATTASQGAADAAALAGAKQMEKGTASEAMAVIQSVALANLPEDLKSAKVTGDIDTQNGIVSVTVSGAYQTAFLSLMHQDSLPYERRSRSTIKRDGFMDFYFMLDVSESMNIAADAVERAKLLKITEAGNNRPCAFACHSPEPWAYGPLSVYQMNQMYPSWKGGPARLRIDVLRDAFATAIRNLLAINADPSNNLTIRISTAGFSNNFAKGVLQSTDEAALKASLAFPTVPSDHTRYDVAFQGLQTMLGTQYDGSSDAKPEKVAVVITDGVSDTGAFATGPIDVTYCSQIKAKGFKLAVLEIKYVEDYDRDGFFASRVAPAYPTLSPALVMCASPGYYYLATDSRQASEKLAALANDIVRQNLRIQN